MEREGHQVTFTTTTCTFPRIVVMGLLQVSVLSSFRKRRIFQLPRKVRLR